MQLARKVTVAMFLTASIALPVSAQALDAGGLAKGTIAAIALGGVLHSATSGIDQQASVSSTFSGNPASIVFNSYSHSDRKIIQTALLDLGFYQGRVDGAWGGATDAAVRQYARQSGMSGSLRTQDGANAVLQSIGYTVVQD